MIDVTPTISLLEAVWVLLALIGVAVNVYGYAETDARLHYLVGAGINGVQYALALDHRRQEAVEATVQGLFLLIGLAAMTIPAWRDDGWLLSVIALVLLIVEALLVVRARQRQVVRRWVERCIDTEDSSSPPVEHGGQ